MTYKKPFAVFMRLALSWSMDLRENLGAFTAFMCGTRLADL
jgi:hypothetical protein